VIGPRCPNKHVVNLGLAAVAAGELAVGSRIALARWAGAHRGEITRLAGGLEIGGEGAWRLAGLASVVTALLAVYDRDAIPGWVSGNNPHLNDRRPLDVLATGDVASVMSAVQAIRTGAFA